MGTLHSLLPGHILYDKDASLHFTLMQLVGFRPSGCTFLREEEAKKAVQKYVPGFNIRFHSLAVTPKSIMVMGTPSIDVNHSREMIRKELGNALEEPYKNNIVHMTVVRFTKSLSKEEQERMITYRGYFRKYRNKK